MTHTSASSQRWLWKSDLAAIALVAALWLLFFWRLFTPVAADQVRLVDGDFSSQFVAFGAYQYARFADGEIPLWDPYNNAGLPFVADTQAAAFYPPRLITIAISRLSGGWSYNALQLEMTFHILAYTLFIYALVRRMTLGMTGSTVGALVSAIIAGYGGFMSGYPPLQLALLESGIWLPLGILGILESTRSAHIRWPWLALTGLALGLSWMAGHPQTSWLATYCVVAYFGYRAYEGRQGWRKFLLGTALFGLVAIGVTAVQLLPTLEYVPRTMREALTFDEKGNGFPFQDVAQFVFPGVVSVWSPLYIGVVGVALAGIALTSRKRETIFWLVMALIAVALSFGARNVVYHTFYNLLPGLRYFRGQERAAYLVANSLAILAGLGAVQLFTIDASDKTSRRIILRALLGLSAFSGLVAGVVLLGWLAEPDRFGNYIGPIAFSAIIACLLLILIISILTPSSKPYWRWLLLGLMVFELFSVNIDNSNYESRTGKSDPLSTPPLVAQVLSDTDTPFRTDGNFQGLYGNYGSLFGVQDIRGISPLFLDGPHAIIQRELPSERAWELFSVRYVFSIAEDIPAPAERIGTDNYRGQTVYLYRLTDPRPFALLLYHYDILDSDEFARALLADPNFDARRSVILNRDPDIALPDEVPDDGQAIVTEYLPERLKITVSTSENAILSIAQVNYPGWRATLDGEQIDILRAYGALTAIAIPAGEHVVEFVYDPISFKIGAVLSLVTWATLSTLGIALLFRSRNQLVGPREEHHANH